MRTPNALSLLKDGELCIVTTKDGEREMRWNLASWCFTYTTAGTPLVCPYDEIEEWRPAAIQSSRRPPV
ncbi:hypothetical protein [Noviherbaspirillum denitrificans]|uniref:Uncharacterized protein n=1 Tax=Noviherbaspirillum denitrificans TaxID=1968433 RepID=A0A254TGA6_9BURK|nr:hypothetical protein [Noviherbaspirillum denitrificans]OWW21660.1 hypothetical protein AYR66_21395 [Noviherbaspirillum denitrificans]